MKPNDVLTDEHRRRILEIEKKTGAQLLFCDYNCDDRLNCGLFVPGPVLDEDGDEIQVLPDELFYILDQPLTNQMTLEQIKLYPQPVQRELLIITELSVPESPWDDQDMNDSCNILSSQQEGHDIDKLLNDMEAYTELLHMGWHLGREQDFQDPFIPWRHVKTEEEEIWEEYLESKQEKDE